MEDSSIYILLLAVLLASLHMIAPDHWIPISVLSSKRSYSQTKSSVLSAAIGSTHGTISAMLAFAVAFAGFKLLNSKLLNYLAILLLVAVSIYLFVNALQERGEKKNVENSSLTVSFFPDPAFLPILLLAIEKGYLFSFFVSLVFIALSGISLSLVVYLFRKSIFSRIKDLDPVKVDYVVVVVLLLTALFLYLS